MNDHSSTEKHRIVRILRRREGMLPSRDEHTAYYNKKIVSTSAGHCLRYRAALGLLFPVLGLILVAPLPLKKARGPRSAKFRGKQRRLQPASCHGSLAGDA